MLRNRCWAIGVILTLSSFAWSQAPEPEKIPLPTPAASGKSGPEKIPLPLSTPPAAKLGEPSSLQQPLRVDAAPLPRTPRVYMEADYLYWWVNHGPSPILLTTSPNNGQVADGLLGGVLGQPDTTVLFTGRDLNYGASSAFRARAGMEVSADGFWTLEAGGFLIPKNTIQKTFAGTASGAPLYTTPFLDAATGQQSALDLNAQSGGDPYLTGGMSIHSDLVVWGAEANLIAHSIRTADRSIDLLIGIRTVSLSENLNINQVITGAQDGNVQLQFPTVGQGAPNYLNAVRNNPVFINDHFGTRNQFYGGQLGGRFKWFYGDFTAALSGKVAFGVTHQQVTIDGSTTGALVADGNKNPPVLFSNVTTPGGFFALQNNIGVFRQNQFTVVPEIGFDLRYAVTNWMHLQVGYSAMYWSNVARPGAQIDSTLNSKLIPSGPLLPTNTVPVGAFIPGAEQGRPYFAFRDTAFWAQGVNVGVEFRY